ncbi:MAG TPA: IS1182 family transposase [Rugosimonospora sp.]|jgi:hypothetical protein
MSLGLAERQGDLLDDVNRFCEATLPENSIFAVLHRERDGLFPDEMFADLFSARGRESVPPSIVSTVMVLQRLQGLSDREAVEAYAFDARWRYAAGVGGYDTGGWGRFAHTVLVDMRARLAGSDRPRRIFEVSTQVAGAAGLLGVKRVLDSAPIYDAVATMDTITLIRSAIRGLLKAADGDLEERLRAALSSGDDYAGAGKPVIDWDDAQARDELIDSRAKDGFACLAVLEGRQLDEPVAEAAQLLATVLGQDLEQRDDGGFAIARRVAADRVISTVDPQARHGHKTAARGFDGYKGHLAVDPDSEIIANTTVTAGNAGDATVAEALINDLLEQHRSNGQSATAETDTVGTEATQDERATGGADTPRVYGDNAYGSGGFHDRLEKAGIDDRCKTQQPVAAGGMFAKDRFAIDLHADRARCPAGHTAPIRRRSNGAGTVSFWPFCTHCPLRQQCTTAPDGRTVTVGAYERQLAAARTRQRDPDWITDYRATRPKVERKIAHLMRRRHGGRRARMRGREKIAADFDLLAAAHNLARLAVLGLRANPTGWAVAAG